MQLYRISCKSDQYVAQCDYIMYGVVNVMQQPIKFYGVWMLWCPFCGRGCMLWCPSCGRHIWRERYEVMYCTYIFLHCYAFQAWWGCGAHLAGGGCMLWCPFCGRTHIEHIWRERYEVHVLYLQIFALLSSKPGGVGGGEVLIHVRGVRSHRHK